MNFLEASRILKDFSGGSPLEFSLLASSDVEALQIFLAAGAAKLGYAASVSTLPFGTLGQALRKKRDESVSEVLLLSPWDLIPECDWRSGFADQPPPPDRLLEGARTTVKLIADRCCPSLMLRAPLPPVYLDPLAQAMMESGLWEIASTSGLGILPADDFSLGSYLACGNAISGASAGRVATRIVDAAVTKKVDVLPVPPVREEAQPNPASESLKVLVTDLDDVLWAGLAAEDGVDGIRCSAEGTGFKHFLYQRLLFRLKSAGVLLAAVSRNDPNVALAPIRSGKTTLREADFVSIDASYEPKSIAIRRLARTVNLGLDSFVFIDDNPVELAEVAAAAPAVKRLRFPRDEDDLPLFFRELVGLFPRHAVTEEDRHRTESYRRLLQYAPAADGDTAGDLSQFLRDLRMTLTVCDRSRGNHERALQLINKTNQFNLNGKRLTEAELARALSAGGKLWTARLDDRTGTHGEILACLTDARRHVLSLVLSCRVFERRVEHAFLSWLLKKEPGALVFEFSPTERNTPTQHFFRDSAFDQHADGWQVSPAKFLAAHQRDLDFFEMKEATGD